MSFHRIIRISTFTLIWMGTWWAFTSTASTPSFSIGEAVFDDATLIEKAITHAASEAPIEVKEVHIEESFRVGLQVGHWKNAEVPRELNGLKKNGEGASAGGKKEWEVALLIAEETAEILREHHITVDILPTTIPIAYTAHAFVAIHADGNQNPSVSGFKIASPYRDSSGKSDTLETILYEEYERATELRRDKNITYRMRGYYAFNWRRYKHAIHPNTPAVILETGFLTSARDQVILIENPKRAAEGIAAAIIKFLGL